MSQCGGRTSVCQEIQRHVFIPHWMIRIFSTTCSFTVQRVVKFDFFQPPRQQAFECNSNKMHIFHKTMPEIWYCKNPFPGVFRNIRERMIADTCRYGRFIASVHG